MVRARVLLVLLAVIIVGLALSSPAPVTAQGGYCYFITAYECYYENAVWCYQGCPSSSHCNGQPEGQPWCFEAGYDCCY